MKISFKQIKDDYDISDKDGFGTIVLSSILILGLGITSIKVFNSNPLVTAIITIVSALFGRPLIRQFLGDFVNEKDFIGEITFSTSNITYAKSDNILTINNADISSINLKYNYIKGKQFEYKDIIHNGLSHLTITTKDNKIIQFKFLIETKKQLDDLKPIWKELYRLKIKIKESMGKYEIKTILFEKDSFSFEKIQELKKELNVDTFY